MATLDDVAAIASSLPEVEERERHGTRTWFIGVLIRLKVVDRRALREAILDGWLACAPRCLANDHAEH